MSGYGLYDPDQSAVDTRWIQPSGEAFRVSLICLRALCDGDGCILDDRVAFHHLVNAAIFVYMWNHIGYAWLILRASKLYVDHC